MGVEPVLSRLIKTVCILPLVASCVLVSDDAMEEDEWVLMMAERHPVISDITELETGEHVAAYRSGGSTSLSYQSGVSHLQLFAPQDGNDLEDVVSELSALLVDSGYELGPDVVTRLCFRYEYEPGNVDHVLVSIRETADESLPPEAVHLSLRQGDSCWR